MPATLIHWNALETKMGTYAEQFGVGGNKASALPYLVLEYVLALEPEEAEDAITDGPDDRGVDAVYVDSRDGRNTVHLFQFKQVSTFEKSKGNFPSNEIDKLLSFCADVLEMAPNLRKTCNSVLWAKVEEIWEALTKPNPTFEIHLASNMQELVPPQLQRLETALGKWRTFVVRQHSLTSIVDLFIQHKRPKIDAVLQLVDKNYFERADGNIRGLICTVEAKEIVRLVSNAEGESVNENVFNDNVRVYLTKKNQINRKIIASAISEKNSEFWYLNNGITMTCDSFSYQAGQRAPKVSIKNLQIVNGGQTSNALFEASREHAEKIGLALVLVRIYETKTNEISSKIAESTNSQTPINTRDLRSNDDVQKTLEESFLDLGFYYERKAKMHADKPRAARIDALVAGQACLAYHLGRPEVAKKDRSKVFSDFYEEVFNENISPRKIIAPLKVLGRIEQEKKDLQRRIRANKKIDPQKLFLIDGAYHVLYAVAALCAARGVDPLDSERVIKLIAEGTKLVSELVEKESADEAFSFNRFFKDVRTKGKIDESVAGGLKKKRVAKSVANTPVKKIVAQKRSYRKR